MRTGFTLTLFSLAISIFFVGCTSVQSDFERAKNRDTISAYNAFREKHSDTKYDEWIESRVSELKEIAEKKRQDQIRREQEAWESAVETDTIQGYADFIEKHKNSSFVDNAQDRLVSAVSREAMRYVDGDRQKIQNGDSFPTSLFYPADMIDSFQGVITSGYINGKGPSGKFSRFGVARIYPLTAERIEGHYERFYLSNKETVADLTVALNLSMGPIVAEVKSSKVAGTEATFIQDPDEPFRLFLHQVYKDGKLVSTLKYELQWGIGVVFLRQQGGTKVYDFRSKEKSLIMNDKL